MCFINGWSANKLVLKPTFSAFAKASSVVPVLEQLSEEYEGKIDIYKIDTEKEQELSAAFGVRSIPTLLFCPVGEEPQMANGALPKPDLEKVIAQVLKVEK